VVGLPASGQIGSALLPTYWQAIGAAMPPHYAADLFTKVLYFSSNNITTPIIVLAVWVLVAVVLLGYHAWLRPSAEPAEREGSSTGNAPRRSRTVVIVVALLVAAVQMSLFALSYISSGHAPSATNLPFATTGSSSLIGAAERDISLKVSHHSDEAAAKRAIDKAKAYGALIPGTASKVSSKVPGVTSNKLLVVPTRSDLAPLDLAVAFEKASKAERQVVTPSSYEPKPLASGDPFGIVLGIVLTPLLIAGYLAATLLRTVTGVAAVRWRGVSIMVFAVVSSLLLSLIVGTWLNGYPADKFWIVWPILALITAVVGPFAAVLQKLLGAAGTFLTVWVIILLGKPSSGGANRVTYLPGFWRTIGPFLPPRNAYILLRNTVYFDGNGTSQALIVLLAYFVVFAVILGILDWRYRLPEPDLGVDRETEAEVAAAAIPAGVAV
jgi:hypothetical protein